MMAPSGPPNDHPNPVNINLKKNPMALNLSKCSIVVYQAAKVHKKQQVKLKIFLLKNTVSTEKDSYFCAFKDIKHQQLI
jgi:hypothetical protein